MNSKYYSESALKVVRERVVPPEAQPRTNETKITVLILYSFYRYIF